ncbi:helix-turn-helix domain-containing protein [Paenibacillus sp. P2(2022)]|uniref:helix-turn-helix domain-containing protein n=1 Tax=Paenibacillus sp. P2(2022) TaxID=2917813 RepID=UPI002406B5EC|nr:S24 family peptidase [Paenibacillus sp. P2(2022)]MDG0056938.1 helix-turn-helix domain-containing protein [Paenibacillus sp. P2(2022)]
MSEITIGELIKKARIANGYKTKKDFADKTGVSPASLTRIEKNTQRPAPDMLMQISKHLNGITYGELMKFAGYLDGLDENHEQFLADFMNENQDLDNEIFNLIDKLYLYIGIDDGLQKELVELFIEADLLDIHHTIDAETLKKEYVRNDIDTDSKRKIINTLEDMLNRYSPKLGEYLKLKKNNKPIPLIGTICAGDGIIADQNVEEYINYPFMKHKQPDYALRVKGDSMVNAGIQDGDIVFMRREAWAEFNGQIVAVIVNGEEGVLKRMKWSEGSAKFNLVPENDSYQSMEVTPNEFIVCGVYVGHFRQ